MEPIVFNVKDKSANQFFIDHATHIELIEKDFMRPGPGTSPYHLMRDDIYLKKSSGFVPGQQVVFQLSDISAMSRKALVNTYTYSVEAYDDVCIKLTLQDFKVNTEEPAKV